MQEQFKSHIQDNFPELKNKHFLIACSGGIDSVILVHLCKTIGLDFSLAHCNFKLRGAESDADEAFVVSLASELQIPMYHTSFDTKKFMKAHKVSLQIAARELRYDWFSELQAKHQIATLVTAHHADDNVETFLINLSRGTGIDGLTGIPERTATIARPLLLFSREQILDYAHRFNISWREDKSNQETKYVRNKIRHKIVPHLKELHPSFLNNFLQSQQYLAETANLLDQYIQELRMALFKEDGAGFMVSIAALKKQKTLESLVYHLFKPFGFTNASAIIDLLSAMSGKELHSASHRLLKDRDYLYLKAIHSIASDVFEIGDSCNSVLEPLSITIEEVSAITTTGIDTLYLDKDHLKFPLTVRKYKTGDYFYPFGMKGVKKLSKYFKDEKYSQFQKEQQWLLCSEDAIVWVIGKRADNRFKVSKKTHTILKFSLA